MPLEGREKPQSGRWKREPIQKGRISGNTMLIRVWGKDRGEPCGDIIHLSLPGPVPYKSLGELVFRIDGIARFLGLLDRGKDFRTWNHRKEETERTLEEYGRPVSGGRSPESLPDDWCKAFLSEDLSGEALPREDRQVICLELIGKQHMSLQGRLRGIRAGEKGVCFRSALELMYLFSQL